MKRFVDEIRRNREYLARGGIRFSAETIRPVLLVFYGAAVQLVWALLVAIAAISVAYYSFRTLWLPKSPAALGSGSITASSLFVGKFNELVLWIVRTAPGLEYFRPVGSHLVKIQTIADIAFKGSSIYLGFQLNASYAFGGPGLTIQTIEQDFPPLKINHH